MKSKRAFSRIAILLAAGWSSAAIATTYEVSGAFQTSGGSAFATLSGGSFSGSFTIDDISFPRPGESSDYLYDAAYSIDLFDSSGSKVTTLANTTNSGAYLEVATTYADLYGGLRLFFYNSSTDYLQLVMPLTFSGTGDIASAAAGNYALVRGSDYAYFANATVRAVPPTASVPETATWIMMIAGLSAAGLAIRRGRALSSRKQPGILNLKPGNALIKMAT